MLLIGLTAAFCSRHQSQALAVRTETIGGGLLATGLLLLAISLAGIVEF